MILRHDLPRSTKRWLVVVAIVAAVGLPTFAGVAQNDSKTASARSYKQAAHTESKATEAPAEQLQPKAEQESGAMAPPQAEPAAKSAATAPGDKAVADGGSVVTGQDEGAGTLGYSRRSIIDTTPVGIPVMATMDGTVTEVRLVDGRGYVVTIDHGDDLVLSFQYCSSVVVKVGDHVRRGQPVAYAGYKAKAVDESVIQPAWLQPIALPADVSVHSESGKVSLPCEGRITSPFGYRTHPVTKVSKLHTGIDIAASTGTPIRAVADGEVITSGWMGAYGNAIVIDHGNGVSTLYAHSSKLAVQKGQKVHRGDVIAYVGATGYATGPRCHFEKRVNGVAVDPLKE